MIPADYSTVVTTRGKTTPASTNGSWAPHTGGKSRVDLGVDDIDPIGFADVKWGARYGGDKVWATTDSAAVLRLYRDGQRCRFYDEHGNQHGDEHANVAPALAHIADEGFVGTNPTLAAAARSAARDRAARFAIIKPTSCDHCDEPVMWDADAEAWIAADPKFPSECSSTGGHYSDDDTDDVPAAPPARPTPPTWADIRSSRFTPVMHLRAGDLMVVPATIRYDDAPELGEMAVREGVHEAATNATTSGRIATVASIATREQNVAGVNRDVSVVTFTDGTTLNAFTTQMFLNPAGEPSDDYKARVPATVVDGQSAGRFAASLPLGDPLVLDLKIRWTGPLNQGWNTGMMAGRATKPAPAKRRR